jgi:hypothetical protein
VDSFTAILDCQFLGGVIFAPARPAAKKGKCLSRWWCALRILVGCGVAGVLGLAWARTDGKPKLLPKIVRSFSKQDKCAASELPRQIVEGKTAEISRLAQSWKEGAAPPVTKDFANPGESIEHSLMVLSSKDYAP